MGVNDYFGTIRINIPHATPNYGPVKYNFEVDYYRQAWLVPDQHVHFFYAHSNLREPQNRHTIFSTYFQLFLKLNSPVHNIIFKLCTGILKHIKCVYRFAEGLVKYKVLFLKPIRMKYDLMVVIFTILLKTWPWKQYDPVTLNIMGYCTGNMCYVVVINAQVLSYPFRRQIKIQQTCVQ